MQTKQIPNTFPQPNENNESFHFKIQQHIGELSTGKNGWNKEVNIVSWNERPARLDIRDWHPDHNKMGKGITLNGAETAVLIDLLKDLDIPQSGI